MERFEQGSGALDLGITAIPHIVIKS